MLVVGAGDSARAALRAVGITDVATLDRDVLGSGFDDATDTWLLTTAGGEPVRAGVVVADRSAHIPWLPDIAGRDDFLGESFHAAQWPAGFDPTGKRVAVIGADSTAGHHIPRLMNSAASVTVFAHPPRRVVDELPLPATRAKRWLRRRIRPAADAAPRPALVRLPVVAITASRVRTADGVDHDADAIIYGTGFAALDPTSGATLVDGMEPYFGVAVRGLPNYFFVTGPDTGAQARYVAECIALMERTDSTRIEVRRSSQRVFNERVYVQSAQPQPVASAFELTSGAAGTDATYEGAATLTIAGSDHPVRVRLAGHLDPIDGHYHWQGTVFGSSALPDESLKQARTATLTVGERSAPARIIERTPWGTHTVAGVGAPPYALS
ncbi:monooxygenase [Mycobacterium sp. IEC1808]|nr:monooxygenase [Mycobacterium sp. IEC1808]